ncbi:MAG: hypothetical protein ACP5NU_01580 [Methanomicrobiales archaeon]|jgi:uncharacterized membrane protein HdeD (DUF308 family)|nr:hypothetical protein [Burkholderiaceae bacterium]NLH26393.1 hypothetical protein [Methanomicrobiales archaeon]HNJ80361.1 hypothetical protein [Methanoregulaceae archaeon]HNW80427.1 hypothetical protein [Methanoregulaceae archaeon]HNY89384.1 hypothetical protein [Methanoregulaceae archaeon]
MSSLDEFLGPLHHGVWEVEIPKESVTEPLDQGWEVSRINIPSPGTIASYRKGQYHVHETDTEWRVHLDNHDPKRHSILHLIDDAPLLLMIGDTFGTLIASTRKKTGEEAKILEEQSKAWKDQILIGLFIILVGIFVITNPLLTFKGITRLFVPLVIVGLGIFTIMKSVRVQPFRIIEDAVLYRGIIISIAGIIAFYLPLTLWIVGLLGILAVWMLATAIVLLGRARKGRSAIPEGFVSRIVIAILSLCLVGLIFTYPIEIVELLMIVLGVIGLLVGIMLFVNGVRLKRRMERT